MPLSPYLHGLHIRHETALPAFTVCSTDALGIQELCYNVMLFFCFSIIAQEENLQDPRPLEGLKAVRF